MCAAVAVISTGDKQVCAAILGVAFLASNRSCPHVHARAFGNARACGS